MLRTLIFSLFLFSTIANVQAEDIRYYDIEMVIFENLNSTDRENEKWSIDNTILIPENTIELGGIVTQDRIPAGANPKFSYTLLPASQFQLTAYMDKLNNTSNRKVLLHTAWRQPGLDSDKAPYLHFTRSIEAGNSAEPQQLEGLVHVILSRYLHLETEMVLGPKIERNDSDVSQGNSFIQPLSETDNVPVYRHKQVRRRIRSGELHYLDHPVIGILFKITPFEPEEKSR